MRPEQMGCHVLGAGKVGDRQIGGECRRAMRRNSGARSGNLTHLWRRPASCLCEAPRVRMSGSGRGRRWLALVDTKHQTSCREPATALRSRTSKFRLRYAKKLRNAKNTDAPYLPFSPAALGLLSKIAAHQSATRRCSIRHGSDHTPKASAHSSSFRQRLLALAFEVGKPAQLFDRILYSSAGGAEGTVSRLLE